MNAIQISNQIAGETQQECQDTIISVPAKLKQRQQELAMVITL
jgi:hypothetical protein